MAEITDEQAQRKTGLPKRCKESQPEKEEQRMEKSPVAGKRGNEYPEDAAPAVDLAVLLVDVRKKAAQENSQEQPELPAGKKMPREEKYSNAAQKMGVEEHTKP